MGIFDWLGGKKAEAIVEHDSNIIAQEQKKIKEPEPILPVAPIIKSENGGILEVPALFPSNVSDFPDYLIDHTVRIVNKGYPFIRLAPSRVNISPLFELRMGYSIARRQYNADIVLNVLDDFATEVQSYKLLAIVMEDLYNPNKPELFYINSMAGKYGVAVSFCPLKYNYPGVMDSFYMKNINSFYKEFQINFEVFSIEEYYKIFWLSFEIFHELGCAFGLSYANDINDIMYRPIYSKSQKTYLKTGNYKMPESGQKLNEILKNMNLKIMDNSSPLFATQSTSEEQNA